MPLIDRIRHRRRRTLALVTGAGIALLAVAGPAPAVAAQKPPERLETSDDAGLLADGLGSPQGSGVRGRGRPVADGSGGYIYRNGRYTPLDTMPGFPLTVHIGLDNRGHTVGSFTPDGATLRGFLREQRGDYTSFDATPDALATLPFDVNDRGTAVGFYAAGEIDGDFAVHGFLRRPNGTITTVDVPGALSTVASGINNRGAVVGNFVDSDGGHGFLLDRGEVTPIDPPGAIPKDPNASPVDGNIAAFDINDRNQIVGFYPDANGTFHGFLYDRGRFTTIDHPDASDAGRSGGGCDGKGFAASAAFGINNRGQVVGQYVDDDGVLHGYVWERKRGFRTIDPPRGGETVAVDINDRGQILLPAPGSFNKGDGCF
jgi:uncharacterized membrane protein